MYLVTFKFTVDYTTADRLRWVRSALCFRQRTFSPADYVHTHDVPTCIFPVAFVYCVSPA